MWMMKKEFLPSCGSLLLMVVLVTGAAHRIGREISLTLAKQGHSIALHYKQSKESASQLAEQINSLKKGKAYIYHADLSDSLSLRKLIHDVAKMGTIDHIVNNASSYEHDTISTVTPESFDKMISVNLKAPLFLSKEFIAYRENLAQSSMSQPRMSCTSIFPSNMVMYPSITNILDQKIACTNADNLSYTIAKHGLHSLTEMLAKESAPMIRVNAVAPGPVLPHTTQSTASFELAQERCLLPQNPSAGDIAEAVSYLISARSVTGQTIFVDSGDRFNSRMVDTPL